MRILLFGSSGWLGRSLSAALRDGCEVLGFDRNGSAEGLFFRGDASRPSDRAAFFDKVGGCEDCVLIHTASVIHPKGRVREFYEVNVSAFEEVVRAFEAAGGSRMIYISSNSPFGAFKEKRILDESAAYDPYLNYGKSKRLAEEIVLGSSLKSIIFRVPWFFGDCMPDRQMDFYRMIQGGKFPVFGNGQNVRSVVDVGDIARAAQRVLRDFNWSESRQYWLSTASYSMVGMIDRIRSAMREEGIELEGERGYRRVPGLISDLMRLADKTLQALGLYHAKVHVVGELNLNIACSAGKFASDFGFEFSDFEQRTREVLRKHMK